MSDWKLGSKEVTESSTTVIANTWPKSDAAYVIDGQKSTRRMSVF